MNNRKYLLNTILAVLMAALLLVAVLVRTFAPVVIIPRLDIPALVLISLAVLLADHYLAPGTKRCWLCVAVLAALTFGLLPWAACFTWGARVYELAVTGGVVFTVTAWLFASICNRISTGPACRVAPWVSALGLYLAAQSFLGMFA